jgi:UDP-N-acetyl-D-mannosaminuronic acid dehydrogenase
VAEHQFALDVAVIGGCGHVGLPLAIALADRGANVVAYDISPLAVAAVKSGVLPFAEPGALAPLRRAIAAGRLTASTDPAVIGGAEHVVVVLPGPDGEPPGLGPQSVAVALEHCAAHFRDGQILILRSTVAPGTTAAVEKMAADLGLDMDVGYCPERIAEGRAMAEMAELPQLVSSRTPRGLVRASALFRRLTPRLVLLSPEEAELAKLFSNVWRYVGFAVANELYMIANDRGLDFERIRQAMTRDYPRAAGLPQAGFAAGPCLVKDTIGLAEVTGRATVGLAAIGVNEGLPCYLADRLAQRYDLRSLTVGILGMAFKGGSDDARASLAYRLRRILMDKARRVLCTDPLVSTDPSLLPLDEVLAAADLLVIAAPHQEYRGLVTAKPVVDVWNVLGRGVLA